MRSLLGPLFNKAPVPFSPVARVYGAQGRGRVPMANELDAMGASAALYAIVSRCATATAKADWHMHDTTGAAARDVCQLCEKEGVALVEKHPLMSLLSKPNPFYTRQELFESGQQHVDLVGEGWLAVSYLGAVPYELWVLQPDRIVVVTDPQEFLLGYVYISPDGQEKPFKPSEILSMRMPAPRDPYRGMGPVQTIMSEIEGNAFSSEWNTNFYRNGARPGGVVKLSRRMSDKEFEKLVDRWNYAHRGPSNAGKTAFLEDGDWVDVKPMSVRDMALVETSNLNRDTILLAYGASKFDVGVLEDVNRAASSSARADFAERMTVPRLDRWKGMLNNDLLPLFPMNLQSGREVVYCSPVPRDVEAARADKLASAQAYKTLRDAGVAPESAAGIAGLPWPIQVEDRTPAPVSEPKLPKSPAEDQVPA
jgi:HK97 family phage portal protein